MEVVSVNLLERAVARVGDQRSQRRPSLGSIRLEAEYPKVFDRVHPNEPLIQYAV